MDLQEFHSNPEVTAAIEKAVEATLQQIGEDPQREGLKKTPHRVGKALQFLTKGYHEDPEAILRSALFEEDYRQMVVVKDIDFYSLCEHHMLPFFGKVHVAYIPNGRITGLSKIARVVDVYARRLQVQERLTTQIKECIQKTLDPLGVMVVIEAEHLCMTMRGVEKQNSVMSTSAVLGSFHDDAATRSEFLSIVTSSHHAAVMPKPMSLPTSGGRISSMPPEMT